MLIKTIRVTNPKNVVLQIPGFIASVWGLTSDSQLEVHFDNEQVIIRPCLHGRGKTTEGCNSLAGATGTLRC